MSTEPSAIAPIPTANAPYYKQMIPESGTMPTYHTLNDGIKNTLNSWLKYGTVFLTYRLSSYYFIDRDQSDTELFDAESLQLVLFILLGFALYYLLIEPYIPINLQHPILQNIAKDTTMFGTVLVSAHLMESYMCEESSFDNQWLKTTGMILLSFASYRIFIDQFIPRDTLSPTIRPIINDWAQFGTFLVVFRLLRGKSVFDQRWILSVLFVLLGFTGYHLITKKIFDIESKNDNL